jgi:phosphotriesterase-related protein
MIGTGTMNTAAASRMASWQEQIVDRVQTVLGPVDPGSLGVVLPHEHLLCDLSAYFVEPTEAGKKAAAYEPVSLGNLFRVRRSYFENRDNLDLSDDSLAIEEARAFERAGGGTIVEVSNVGLGRDPRGLVKIAQATGLNIVMGCGYYIGVSHPADVRRKPVQEIAGEMIRDVLVGVGDTGIRSGIIGEMGCSDPLEADEKKVLEAAVLAQRATGAALNVHPSPFNDELALEIVEILGSAGADLDRVVLSHCDQWCYGLETRRRIADAGCFIEHDTLGFQADMEYSFGRWRYLPSDAQRLNDIRQLIDDGYLGRLLISHDNCTKHRLRSFGGWGYAHILENLVPVMRAKGFTEEHLHALLVENPRRVLTIAPAREKLTERV